MPPLANLVGYLLTHLNPSLGYIQRTFDWPIKDRSNTRIFPALAFMASVLVSLLAVGAIFGSLLSNRLLTLGRRNMLIVVTSVYLAAVLLVSIPPRKQCR